ncbi:MAG: gluconate 2-dehydrogenase subunit 3 family protein [Proteobacteria bacterium]|nr:gluconate 2-dehydrogenase subunit 3 family protein [Pseudomonadota bacterium]
MSEPRITRRQMLAAAGVLSAAGAVGIGVRVGSWWDQDPGAEWQALSPREAELFDALADAMFPPGGTPALSGSESGVTRWFDAVLATQPDPTGDLIRLLLHALDDWTRVSTGKSLTGLSVTERGDKLRGWLSAENHLVRGAVSSIALFVSMGYAGHPDVREACGWIWPCGYER